MNLFKRAWSGLRWSKVAALGLLDRETAERQRLTSLPRYVPTVTDLPGFTLNIPDGPSFLATWKEVFDKRAYEFKPTCPAPRILDCGANVGVSCLFFKQRYPAARVTAFEPDPNIFAYLRDNLTRAGITDVELIPKGVWHSETVVRFHSEGADAGRIAADNGTTTTEIQTVRLYDYLNEQIDLLKVDIEGAETEVLLDAASRLDNVQNLFVEYHSFVGKPQTLDQMLHVLKQTGFRVQIQPVHYSTTPLLEVKEYLGMDLQLNVFAYRDKIVLARNRDDQRKPSCSTSE